MEKVEFLFRFVVVLFGFLGLWDVISTNIAIPVMFLFAGLILLANAKMSYDKGKVAIAKVFFGKCSIDLCNYGVYFCQLYYLTMIGL